MRRFSSYGPIDTDLHYYVPRTDLIEQVIGRLVGENPGKGGHYITVWAPRQRGKTWVMQQAARRLRTESQFDVVAISLEHLKVQPNADKIAQFIAREISQDLAVALGPIDTLDQFYCIFEQGLLKKPLILILDEFDALPDEVISSLVSIFRNIYISRQYQTGPEPKYLLHGLALVGVRSVLGVESATGSPFNVQQSLCIPNLTLAEVEAMFGWYERESGQKVELTVVARLYDELQGQPGLSSWLGELLTERYNPHPGQPLTLANFEEAYAAALKILPNNTILNIISKAKQEQTFVLELFRTDEKLNFAYDHPTINFLYLNGIIDWEQENRTEYYLKFACPFVQKRLFNYFAHALFPDLGQLFEPFANLADPITSEQIQIKPLLRRYQAYLHQNRDWLLQDAPCKANLRPYEAVYHFSLYMFLAKVLQNRGGQVYPEFPTGNGQIDLIINYAGRMYGLELKSYTDDFGYRRALKQAARYGQQLCLTEISLVFFVETINEANRKKYETLYKDEDTQVTVTPIFVETLDVN
jgi:hypothetical protein